MTPKRAAVFLLIKFSPAGIGAAQIRERLGMTEGAVKKHLKCLRRQFLIAPTTCGVGALWAVFDRVEALQGGTAGEPEQDLHPFTQRLVAADEATPLRPLGPRSVFEIAS